MLEFGQNGVFEGMLRIIKEALRFERLTNSDAKGTKRSVNMWATNFCKGCK